MLRLTPPRVRDRTAASCGCYVKGIIAQISQPDFYGEAVVIRFDGLDADSHRVDMSLLAESMKGLSRIIGVSGNFAATEKVVRQRDAFVLRVLVEQPEAHCFELTAWLQWVNQNPLITTIAGGLVVTLVAYTCKKAAGDREEMKQLRGALEVAIRELGHRDETVVGRLLTTIDRMADSLRPAVRQAVAPIGESVGSVTVSDPSRTKGASLGAADKAAILSDAPLEVGPEATYRVRFTELDMETGTCKLAFEEETEEGRISGKITDPLFSIANNPYALALAGQ